MAHIRPRGPRSYEIRVYLGRGTDGKKKYLIETFKGTKGEAQRRAAELEVAHRPRVSGPRKAAMSLAQYLDLWLRYVKGSVSDDAWHTYAWHVRRLKAAVGSLPLYGLTGGDLQQALRSLTGAAETVRKIAGTLRTALRQATVWGYLPSDPTIGLRLPKREKAPRRVLTPEQLRRLLEALRRYRHHLVVRLLAVTGMRLGEALGLTWQDVDFEKGTVTVRRAADWRRGRLKDKPKTPASVRTLTLDPETLDLLRAHRRAQRQARVTPLHREADLVFRSRDGLPLRERAVRITLKRALRRAGLPEIRVHDLRHTAASILLAAGRDLATVAAFLGHSNPATTATIYVHPLRSGESLAAVLDSQQDSQ